MQTSIQDYKPYQKKSFSLKDDKLTDIQKRTLIINRLNQLLLAARQGTPSDNKLDEISTKLLDSALQANEDICNRLTEIATKQFYTPASQSRQLADMALYLTILNHRVSTPVPIKDIKVQSFEEIDAKKLKDTLFKIKEAATSFNTSTTQIWTTDIKKIEQAIQRALTEENPLPQTSLLNTLNGIPITHTIFAHIHAEALIKGSTYEGSNDLVMVRYLKEYLETNRLLYQSTPNDSLLKMLSDAEKLAAAANTDIPQSSDPYIFKNEFPARCKKYHETLTEIVSNLVPGEKTIAPLGWISEHGGHSMKLGIEKENDGKLRIVIYNTGSGLRNYHASIVDNEEKLYQPFIEISGVDPKRVLNPLFSQALLELLVVKSHPGDSGSTEYSAKDVYGFLLNALDGNIVFCRGERNQFIFPQFSGICTWASWMGVLHANLPLLDHDPITLDLAVDSLCSFYQDVQNTLATDEENRHLLHHASINTAQCALDAFHHHSISLERLQQVHATLIDLQEKLEEAEGKALYSQFPDSQLIFSGIESLIPPIQLVKPWKNTTVESGKEIVLQKAKDKPPSTPIEWSWMDDSNTLVEGLAKFVSELSENTGAGANAIDAIEGFFTLQAQPAKETAWRNIPSEKRGEAIVQLANLGEFLFSACKLRPENKRAYLTYAFYLKSLSLIVSSNKTKIHFEDEFHKKNYEQYLNMVTSSLKNGSLVKDQNLYRPEERYLRQRTLELFSQQLGIENEKKDIPPNFTPSCEEKATNQLQKPTPNKGFAFYEFKYIEKLLENDASLLEKLKEKYSKENISSHSDYIARAFCDFYGEILPAEFCAQRRLDMLATELLNGSILQRKDNGTFDFKLHSDEDNYYFKSQNYSQQKSSKLRDFSSEKLFNDFADIRITQNRTSKTYDSESDIMVRHLNEWQKDLQLILAQGDINLKEQCLEQQLFKLISYFSEKRDLLANPDMRMLCRLLLFENHYFEQILSKNPALAELFLDFTNGCFEHFAIRGDIAASTFIIEIASTFDKIAQFNNCPIKFPNFRAQLIDLLSRKTLSPTDRNDIYCQIAASYVTHPPTEFNEVDGSLLLQALVHQKVYPKRPSTEQVQLLNEQSLTFLKDHIQDLLQSDRGSMICNEVVKSIDPLEVSRLWDCKTFYPNCCSQDGIYVLNVETLELRKNSYMLTGMPKKFYAEYLNNFFTQASSLFTKNNYPTSMIRQNCYEFTDERGIQTQYEQQYNWDTRRNEFSLRQKLNGRWYQLSNLFALEVNLKGMPDDFRKLCWKNTLWVPLDDIGPSDILIRNQSLKTTHVIQVGKKEILTIEEGRQLINFLIKYGEESSKREDIIREKIFSRWDSVVTLLKLMPISNEEKSLFKKAYLLYKNQPIPEPFISKFRLFSKKYQEEEVKIENENKRKFNEAVNGISENDPAKLAIQKTLNACEASNKSLDEFFRVDAFLKILDNQPPLLLANRSPGPNILFNDLIKDGMLWKDSQGELKELDLPELGLSFSIKMLDGNPIAYSTEHPGFFIAEDQLYRGIGVVPGAIVLKNAQGKHKVVFPYGTLNLKAKGSLNGSLKDVFIDNKKKTISFDLDSKLHPIPAHKSQQLYLAYILFAQKKYRAAQTLLRTSFSQVLPFTADENELLGKIAHLAKESKDLSPHAIAVTMKALSLLPLPEKSNDPDESRLAKDTKTAQLCTWIEKYDNYTQQLGLIPDLHLTREEEEKALLYLIKAVQIDGSDEASKYTDYLIKCLLALYTGDQSQGVQLPTEPKPINTPLNFLSLCQAITDYSYMNKPINQALLTRPLTFLNEFKSLYSAVFSDIENDKLAIKIAAAEQCKAIPRELVILLRSAAREVRNPLNNSAFPPSLQVLSNILAKKDEKSFAELLKTAAELENEWKLEQKQSLSEIGPLVGESVSNHPRSKEAQNISKRRQKNISKSKISKKTIQSLQRKEILTAKQFEVFEKQENQGLHFTNEQLKDLQDAVTTKGAKELPMEADELAKNIETYWALPEHHKDWHRLDPKKLLETETQLLVAQSTMGKRITLLEQEVLQFANDLSKPMQAALLFEVEKMGSLRQKITRDDLTLFMARSRAFTLIGKNPALENQENILKEKCFLYLSAKAEQQQLNRAIAHFKKLCKFKPTKELPTDEKRDKEYNRLSEMCYRELTRIPPYDAIEQPELLVFEVLENIGLHKWQYKDLMRMLHPKGNENSNVIIEKVMGSGKTKVYLPILALAKADGDHLPIIVVHASQYESVAQAMQVKSGQMFSQVAHTLQFSRGSDTSAQALKKILSECQRVRKDGHFMIVTDKTMHSLSLAFDQLWDSYLSGDVGDDGLIERINIMREILNLFKDKGKAIFDEADLLLNCRYEVVYSMGDPNPIASQHADIVADLYQSIEAGLKILTPFTLESYEKIKPDLIKSFVEGVLKQKMAEYDLTKITEYLEGKKSGAEYVETAFKDRKDFQNILAIALHEFKELLPIVLDKRCGEHFGYSDNPDKILPVPYLASGVPSPTSEYSFPYALLDYTVETLKADGVSAHLLKSLVQKMQSSSNKEIEADSSLKITDTNGYKQFLELCQGRISIPFLSFNDDDLNALVKIYQDKKNPPDIYAFAKKYMFPAVTIHNRKLTSTPYSLGNLFYELQGFTGTPWNNKTYPNNIQTLRDKLSAGKTQGLIWKNSQTVHPPISNNFKAAIKQIAKIQSTGSYHAFIDVGALFNGIDNETVAKKMLKRLPKTIEGVLFFKNNRPVVLERGKIDPTPFEQCGLTKEQLYIYYDQWHTTGTDFKIADKSLLSVGKNTKMRDLEQGYMRDRQAELGKRVEFIISEEDSQYISKELSLQSQQAIGTAEILRIAEINQERELKEQLLMASFGKIKQCINNHLRGMLKNPEVSPEKIHEVSLEIKKLIGEPVFDSPYDQFGRFSEMMLTSDYFDKMIKQVLTNAKVIIENKELYPNAPSKEQLEKELWKCIDLSLLPKELSSSAENTPDQLVEKQSQQEVQQERMAMVQKELMSENESEKRSGAIHWNWDPSLNTFDSSFYNIISIDQLRQIELPAMNTQSIPWLPTSKGQAPFISLNDIFKSEQALAEFADVFDIEVSYNFLPVRGTAYKDGNFSHVHQQPFQKSQLKVNSMIICQDTETGKAQLRLISQADAGFFFRKLGDECLSDQKSKKVETTLYHMNLGCIQSNLKPMYGKQNLKMDEEIQRKIVQAKFFNSDVIYTKHELQILEAWIRDKGVERMERLFTQHILTHKPNKKEEYPESPLYKIFQKVKK